MTNNNKSTLLIWLFGMAGVLAVNIWVVPDMISDQPLPFPIEVAVLLAIFQSALLLALASWGGSRVAGQVGLQAPMVQALVDGRSLLEALRPQLRPGLTGGLIGALILISAQAFVPGQLDQSTSLQPFPLLVKLTYGGVTEEILLRWGVMSFFAWIMWRFLQKKSGVPAEALIIVAILLSALLFALGHLPAASLIAGEPLTAASILYVIIFNSLFGLVAGYLFWRYGLESAMLAHIGAHLFSHFLV